jgi:hypothetical protein
MTTIRELYRACRRVGMPIPCALRVALVTTWRQRQ